MQNLNCVLYNFSFWFCKIYVYDFICPHFLVVCIISVLLFSKLRGRGGKKLSKSSFTAVTAILVIL